MNLQAYKTIVVLLDIDMGCNHMANLIATSPKLADRVEQPGIDYLALLTEYYQKKVGNAHASPIVSNFDDMIRPVLPLIIKQSTSPFVLGGHLPSWHGESGDAVKALGKTLVLLGSSDTVNDAISTRAGQEFVTYFLENYKKDKVANYTNTPLEDIVEFDPNLLFSPDVTELLTSLDDQLGLELNIPWCQQLHSVWFDTILQKK